MKSAMLKNTATNYLTMFVRILQGVLVTRWTVNYLGPESYGLWSLMWSFFAYALLLDFGFGVSAQKYTSAGIFKTDIARYNKIISAVFSFHMAMFLIIVVGTTGASFILGDIIRVHDAEKLAYCRTAFLIFGIGTAFVFPLGMFSEILVGLQKFYLRNYVNTSFKIFELVGTITIFLCGGRLISLVIFTISSAFLSSLTIAIMAYREIAGFKIVFKIEWKIFREICGFSGFAYLMSLANLLLSKSNRLLISIFCGLPSVGAFHLASRLSDFCYMGAMQYQENIRPISASLYASGEIARLRTIIFNSMRWNSFVSLLFILPTLIYSRELISFLFNVDDNEIVYMARLFVVSTFLSTAFRKIPEAFLQMAERHKLAGYVTMGEALANVFFNLLTLPKFGVTIVLWNSIVIKLVCTGVFLIPAMMRTLKFEIVPLLTKVYLIPISIGVVAFLPTLGVEFLRSDLGSFWTMCAGSCVCVPIFFALSYFVVLSKSERDKVWEKLAKLRNKFAR